MTSPPQTSIITEIKGDLFALTPDNSVLVQVCNTRGKWGAGVAERFKELYPSAYKIYTNHCSQSSSKGIDLLGTTLLIAPQVGDFNGGDGRKGNWVVCLFTSRDYGKRKGSVEQILGGTRGAVEDLKRQLEELKGKGDGPGEVWGCRFNSKNFGVEWELSWRILEEVGVGMVVVEFDE